MEETIIQGLLSNNRYFTKAYSHLNSSLFSSPEVDVIFTNIEKYVENHNTKPSLKEIALSIKESNSLNKDIKKSSLSKLKEIAIETPINNVDFLLNKTEKWVQRKKLTESIFKAADIIQSDGEFEPIIGMVENALQVSFNSDTGMSYQNSVEDRAKYYHRKIQGISTGIPSLDHLLGGGYMNKTLNLISAPSHGGKSALLACVSANMVLKKTNILYITLEMSEEETAKRIDANILDIDINELPKVSEEEIIEKFNKVKDNFGELIIKEYPAGTFNTLHLEALVNELENKGFIPDIIMIDYLGLMASSRTTLQKAGGTYMYVKTIAEECHGFAKKYNLPIVSAAQLNRCLDKNTIVEKENGVKTKIEDINVGDIIKGYNGYVEVKEKTKTRKQKRYKVTLKSGKSIIVSKNHRFPTKFGLMSIENGLEEGTLIKTEGSTNV